MFKNNLITGLRKLLKDRFYSLINVSRLAIGLTGCLLIIFYIQDELSYDKFHEKSSQIYRICALGSIGNTPINQVYTCAPLPQTLIADYPEVIQAVRIAGKWDAVLNYGDQTFYEDQVLAVDSTFFDVFSFRLLEGDPAGVLREPNTVVITESIARKYFGEENAMGKVFNHINEGKENPVKVVGVMEDVPNNAHFHFDFLMALSTFEFSRSENWWNNNFKTYLVLLGLVSFTTEQRTKEIGIRKAQGASAGRVLLHLWKEFGRWILISTLMAIPLSWYLFSSWLQNFAYRIKFQWWTIALAALIALVIAIITVSYQTIRAAQTNPAESLRYE